MLKSFFANTTNNVKHDKKTKELVGALRNETCDDGEKAAKAVAREQRPSCPNLHVKCYRWHQQSWPPYGGHAGASARAAGQDGAADAPQLGYEHLEGRSRAAQEMHHASLQKMEDNNRVIREMRRKIQMLAAEKESS